MNELSCDTILLLAERDSGGYGLADAGLVARLARLTSEINARGPYDGVQLREMQAQIVRILANRLKMALDRSRNPAIAAETITRPVFIIGFPRSGTTLLHSLLAEDPAVLKPQTWQMFAPSPPPGAGPVAAERFAFAQRQMEAWMDFCPAQKSMHPYVDKGAFQLIEDDEVLSLDLHNAYPYHFWKVPSLDPSFVMLGGSQTDAFAFHKQYLQHFQWNTGKTRWVCKSPSGQMNLAAIFAEYPDALCVWAHRPYGEIYASNVALRAATFDTIQGRAVDWAAFSKPMVERTAAMVNALIASAEIDDPRILHFSFRDVSAGPVGVVRKVYERQGLDLTAEVEARVRGWLADPENAADRHGRYPYSYEAFGLDRAWIDDLFAGYSRRFGLD